MSWSVAGGLTIFFPTISFSVLITSIANIFAAKIRTQIGEVSLTVGSGRTHGMLSAEQNYCHK
jgi:hypothetical protein